MPVTINGTTGIAGVDGSNTTPAIKGGTSTGTGVFYGTNTVSLATGGTTAVTVDSSQRIGFGATPNASYAGWQTVQVGNGQIVNAAEQLKILGNCYLNSAGASWIYASSSNATRYEVNVGGQHQWFTSASGTAGNAISWTQAMTLDSSGNLLVGVTSTFSTVGVTTTSTFSTAGSASWAGAFQNTNSLPVGVLVKYSTDVNGAGNSFIYCQGNTTLRAEIRSNGGLANYSANNANLSDIRTKTDINDAPAYLNKICSIPVRTFKYIDQTHDDLNLGVIAQEVEVVAPELVDTDGFGEIPDDGVPLKAIYQTDLQYALMKCIQELSAKLDAATARIAALEAK